MRVAKPRAQKKYCFLDGEGLQLRVAKPRAQKKCIILCVVVVASVVKDTGENYAVYRARKRKEVDERFELQEQKKGLPILSVERIGAAQQKEILPSAERKKCLMCLKYVVSSEDKFGQSYDEHYVCGDCSLISMFRCLFVVCLFLGLNFGFVCLCCGCRHGVLGYVII